MFTFRHQTFQLTSANLENFGSATVLRFFFCCSTKSNTLHGHSNRSVILAFSQFKLPAKLGNLLSERLGYIRELNWECLPLHYRLCVGCVYFVPNLSQMTASFEFFSIQFTNLSNLTGCQMKYMMHWSIGCAQRCKFR